MVGILLYLTRLVARAALLILSLTTLFAAGELWFRPESRDIHAVMAGLAIAAALLIPLLHHLYLSALDRLPSYRGRAREAEAEAAGLRAQVNALENRRQRLSQQVESLTTHRNLAHVATHALSLEDFLDELARMARDHAGVRDLLVFLKTDAAPGPTPHAYYQVGETTELCLCFHPAGGVALAEEMDRWRPREGAIDPEALRGRNLSIAPEAAHVVVRGELTFRGAVVGRLRLTLLHLDMETIPDESGLLSLVAGELGTARIANAGLDEAMACRQVTRLDSRLLVVDLVGPLRLDGEELGAARLGFRYQRGEDLEAGMDERRQVLTAATGQIARVLHTERIYEQAIKDGLTGLFNKRHMMNQFENLLRVAGRHGAHLSLILIDIDHFKKVNDTWGHLTGDIILREVGAILLDSVRACDLACRYGGEELAIVLPEGSLEGTRDLAERLRARIEAYDFRSDQDESLRVTASLGVAEFVRGMKRPEDVIAKADAALYEAKQGGRNRVVCAAAAAPAPAPRASSRASRPARRRESVRI